MEMRKGPCNSFCGPVPAGWAIYPEWVKHPADGQLGALARCHKTGVYCLLLGGSMRALPQDWAQRFALHPDVVGVVIAARGHRHAPLKRSAMEHKWEYFDGTRYTWIDVPTYWKPNTQENNENGKDHDPDRSRSG